MQLFAFADLFSIRSNLRKVGWQLIWWPNSTLDRLAGLLAGWPGTTRSQGQPRGIQEAPNVDISKVLATFLKIE